MVCLSIGLLFDFYPTAPQCCLPPGPPTQLSAYKALLQEEVSNNLAGLGGLGETQFVNNGLRLEYDQYVLDYFFLLSFAHLR